LIGPLVYKMSAAPNATTSLGPSKPSEGAALLAHVQSVWDRIRPNSSIYNLLLVSIQLVQATPCTITAHLRIEKMHVNSRGTLHGAVSAAIVDWAGGMAIATLGYAETGVSTDIHVSYLAAAWEGEVLEITGRANRVGGTLAFTTVEIATKRSRVDGEDKVMICTASHTKYVGGGRLKTSGQVAKQEMMEKATDEESLQILMAVHSRPG
jgi:acyl-coenzyme A thioesterase 13